MRPRQAKISVDALKVIFEALRKSRRETQALWDAVYLTHPDKQKCVEVYVKRVQDLQSGKGWSAGFDPQDYLSKQR